MKIQVGPESVWYHGSNLPLTQLREGSTITPWQALAEAFSHKPAMLCYDDDGRITHNGTEKGYLYQIAEPLVIGRDIQQHPRTTMDPGAEFLVKRPLSVQLIAELPIETHAVPPKKGAYPMKKHECPCGYVYDPAVGDPDSGIAPGTAWEDVPEDWICPICGLGKDAFTEA